MARQDQRVIRFADWSAGEFDDIGARRAPPGSFSALNMVVYKNGSIGPRNGLVETGPTGTISGTVWGFGATSVPGGDGFIIVGNKLYQFDLHNPAATATLRATLDTTPTRIVDWIEQSNRIYFTVYGDKLYRLDAATGSVSEGNGPGGLTLAPLDERLAIASTAEDPSRIYYSEPPGFLDYPELNFFDVGDQWPIEKMLTLRNSILAIKRTGWFQISGTLGVDFTVRKLAARPGVLEKAAAVGTDDQVWFAGLFDRFPTAFNGVTFESVPHLTYADVAPAGSATPFSVVPLANGGVGPLGLAFIEGPTGKVALLYNGVWTLHDFPFGIRAAVDSGGMMALVRDAAGTPDVYTWNYALDKPPNGATYSPRSDQGTDSLVGTLTLPEWWADIDENVRVREVVVDCSTYDTNATGAGNFNHFTLTAYHLGLYEQTGFVAVQQEFDEDPSLSDADGLQRRLRFFFEEAQQGGGFRLAFTDIRGVELHEVNVVLDVLPRRRGGT